MSVLPESPVAPTGGPAAGLDPRGPRVAAAVTSALLPAVLLVGDRAARVSAKRVIVS